MQALTKPVDLNASISLIVGVPKDFKPAEISELEDLILKGGEVNSKTLTDLLLVAYALCFARAGEKLVGVGGIKRPYDTHRNRVFRKAVSKQKPSDYRFELGWIYVEEDARGRRLSNRIVSELMAKVPTEKIYSTSGTDNLKMHASLKRHGFNICGRPYTSDQGDHKILLFLRGAA